MQEESSRVVVGFTPNFVKLFLLQRRLEMRVWLVLFLCVIGSSSLLGSSTGQPVEDSEGRFVSGTACYSSSIKQFEICGGSCSGRRSIASKKQTSVGFSVTSVSTCCSEGAGGCGACSENVDTKSNDGCVGAAVEENIDIE